MSKMKGFVQINLSTLSKEIDSMTVSQFYLKTKMFYNNGWLSTASLYTLRKRCGDETDFIPTKTDDDFSSIAKGFILVDSPFSSFCQKNVHLVDSKLDRYMNLELIEIMTENDISLFEKIKKVLKRDDIHSIINGTYSDNYSKDTPPIASNDLILVIPLSVK